MNIYEFKDYKSLLRKYLLAKKESHSSYTFTAMAEACKIQKSYLSRVLNSDIHLNDDQLFLACRYLGMTRDERGYVYLLHSYARSVLADRRKSLLEEIKIVREQKSSAVSSRLAQPETLFTEENARLYYEDPYNVFVHVFVAVEKYAKDPEKICTMLNIDKKYLDQILSNLEALGLIKYEKDRYIQLENNLTLPPDSNLRRFHRINMRLKTLDFLQKAPQQSTTDYSVVFSADEESCAFLREKIIQAIKAGQEKVLKAESTQVYQFDFSLLQWG